MKAGRQNEMDLLLRRMAKQSKSVSEGGNGSQQVSAHLDADELNAFAEHALPPSAQARYTAHLVDCASCRQLVSQLSAAAGLRVPERKAAAAPSSFWQKLPAFLSPAVLRFAVPALGMLAIITVGIIAFRQQRPAGFVARINEPAATKPAITQTDSTQTGATQGDTRQQHAVQSPTTAVPESQAVDKVTPLATPATPLSAPKPAAPAEATKQDEKKAVAGEGVDGADTSSRVIAKDAPRPSKSGDKAGEEAQPKFAPEPAAAPATARTQAQASQEANKNEAVTKEKAVVQDYSVVRRERDERAGAEDREAQSKSRKAATAGRGGALTAGGQGRRTETEQAKRADQDDEIREVSGRRFRRQGNSWIDTAYDSNRTVTTVVRGSEQYRALVADEPGIATIADRLAGEVVVVWKGRAYRIR